MSHEVPSLLSKFLNAISAHGHVDNLTYKEHPKGHVQYTLDIHTRFGTYVYEIWHDSEQHNIFKEYWGWKLVGMRGQQNRYHNPQWDFQTGDKS